MESRDLNLGRLVEEYHRRVAQGQRPKPEDFRHEAGVDYTRFLAILEQEAVLDEVLEGTAAETYPRTFGEYTLIGVLGRGGIGNVYKAVHRPLGRTVALKVLQGGWAGEPELVERFQRGARAAAQVEHDHVVRIYDVGVFEGRPYIAMSYVEGASLQQVFRSLREAGPPPFGPTHHRVLDGYGVPGEGQHTAAFVHRIARLLAGPVDALAAYHDAGIIHRDVKPGNLLLDSAGHLVLTDFDLARRLETSFQTRSGGNLGTPGYMSPEQWDPLIPEVDGRADLYSCGCVLFEALAQRPPFENGADPSRLMKRVLQENAPDPAQFVPGLPIAAGRVIRKALERRREDRYQSAAELRADLAALGRGAEVAARPVPVAKRAARWGWGKKWAVVAALAVAGSATWLFQRPATLHIAPRPAADVWIGDHNVGRSPVSHDVAAGKHVIRLERSGFKPEVFHVEIGPGGSELVDPRLVVIDENDPEVREAFFEQTGIRLPDMEIRLDRTQTDDADRESPALPMFPRGKVRRADLATFAAELYRPVTADIVFLDADGAVVLQRPGVYGTNAIKLEFTDEDRARLETGKTYRWELRVDRGEPTPQATFTLVEDPGERLFRVRDVVTHPKLRDLFEIGFLTKEGLHVAAFRRAMDGWQQHEELEFLALAWGSLERLGIHDSGYARTLVRLYQDEKDKDGG